MSETALTSLGKLEVTKIIKEGGKNSRLLQAWLRNPSRVLVVMLVGNNVANIVCSSLVTLWAEQYFPLSFSYVLGVFTFLFILFAEIMPKVIAKQLAIPITPYAMRFLNFISVTIFPVIWVIQHIIHFLTKILQLPSSELNKPLSEEEITHTIEMATRQGGLDKETGAALSNLIDFPDLKARDIMTPRSRIKAVSMAWSFQEVLQYASNDGHSRYPVYSRSLDDIVGFLLTKDLFACFYKQNVHWTRMMRRAYFVSEFESLGFILKNMKRKGIHLAVVRNETGVVTGLLTFEDLIEEIVGQVRDETDDPEEAGLEAAMGAPRMVNGEIPIVDFNEIYKTNLSLGDSYSTLNGYLLERSGGSLPEAGTLIIDDEVTFRIHSISDVGIATVEVIKQ
jgi:CBS domain containing-hemolysin-like protein